MKYEQDLIKIIEPIKKTTISRLNKVKKWNYGYNKEHDVIVISKTGQIGEIYEIQNLRIALPKVPKNVYSNKKGIPANKPISRGSDKEVSVIKESMEEEAENCDFIP